MRKMSLGKIEREQMKGREEDFKKEQEERERKRRSEKK